MNEETKYYAVECKCGHTGSRMYYIPITFAVAASDAKEAAKKARSIPRCKHHHKDCILDVEEIGFDKYVELRMKNDDDPYLKCHSIQEQNKYDLKDRFVIDPHYFESIVVQEEDEQIHQNYFGKTKIRNPKRFIRNYCLEEAYSY